MIIVWTDNALEDLEQLFNFYNTSNPNKAINIYNTIVNSVEILTHYPNLAQIESMLAEQTKTFRSLVTYSGLIKVIYYIEGNTINISHIWDCRQNPSSIRTTI